MDDMVKWLRDRYEYWALVSKWPDWVLEAADRIEALETALKKANANHAHFEREWYLATDRIEALEAEMEARIAEAVKAEREAWEAAAEALAVEVDAITEMIRARGNQ